MQTLTEPQVHRWTRDEYYRMGDIGLFDNVRVELIEGQVIEMSPIGAAHMAFVTIAGDILKALFGSGYFIRVQGPLDLGKDFQPQPDIAVITGKARDYVSTHPTSAVLVVEVADSSLASDRTTKASLYANAGIVEYWLVNLVDRQLEVFRQPGALAGARYGSGYRETLILTAGETVAPLAKPEVQIAVTELLP